MKKDLKSANNKAYGPNEIKKIVNKLSVIGIVGNIILCAFKFAAGIIGNSAAMVSDAIHSLSDVFATFIAFIGVKLAARSADEEHQYGHERLECVASLSLGLVLAATGLGLAAGGIRTIIAGNYDAIEAPTILPLIAAIVSIASKEAMYRYTMHYAKLIDSDAFRADAWHHRSDAFSSIGSLVGIGAALAGYPVMDSVAALVICVFILKVAFDIIKDALSKMLDTSYGAEFEAALADFIRGQEGVRGIDMLQTRSFGNRCYVDVEISVDRGLSLVEAHDIAEAVHDGIEENFPEVKHVMVHVNPET